MAVFILPDAQADLLGLQDYQLDKWGEASWLKAGDEIFDKLEQVDAGLLNGSPVQELATVGIGDYLNVYTSHHKLVYKYVGSDTYVYLVAGHRQEFPTLLMKRLFKVKAAGFVPLMEQVDGNHARPHTDLGCPGYRCYQSWPKLHPCRTHGGG